MTKHQMELMEKLNILGNRFAGWSVDYRLYAPWPAKYRIRVIANKNERSDYRIEVFGNTLEEAMGQVLAKWPEEELCGK